MSHSPAAQNRHGTGSGRRTIGTTRSPAEKSDPGGAAVTRPAASCPRISDVRPGGGQPYSPATISTSVPQIPTAVVSTSTPPSDSAGSSTDSRAALLGSPGTTLKARIAISVLCDQTESHAGPAGGSVVGRGFSPAKVGVVGPAVAPPGSARRAGLKPRATRGRNRTPQKMAAGMTA